MMTRRTALKTAALAVLAAGTPGLHLSAAPATATPQGPFELPPLPYPSDALEPYIDAATMELHHGKHHAAYVNNANKALADQTGLQRHKVEDLIKNLGAAPEAIRTTLRNNAGGHYNHSLFWQMMKKGGGGQPRGELARAIDVSFTSFAGFQTKFTEMATKVFGSGWAWLVRTPDGKLVIESTPNQDSPVMLRPEVIPLLGLDVWEHAYYLKYQNRRPDYISAWFNVVNWDFVAQRLTGK